MTPPNHRAVCRFHAASRLLSLATLLVLAGCGSTELREEATPALPESFSQSGEERTAERWWQGLADPRLDELVDTALDNNLSLSAARSRLHQAEAVARRGGADLFPSVNAEGSVKQERRDDNPATDVYGVGVAASYEVDLWGRVRSERDAAVHDAEASRGDLRAAAITLTARVARTWYNRVEARAQLDLLDRQLTSAREVMALVEKRFRTGHAPAADRHRQRREIERLAGERAQARARLETLDHELALLLGRSATDFEAPTGELPELPPLPATGLPGELVLRRPDLRAGYLRLQAADARAAAAVANRFPRLDLSASLTGQAASASELVATWITNLSAGLVMPIIDGGSRRAEADRARAATDEATMEYAESVLEAVGEVEDALARERHQRDYLNHLSAEVTEAERLLENTRRRYRYGEADHLAVLDAVNGYHSARRQHLTARREALEHRIDLHRALAGGWSGIEQPVQPAALTENRSAGIASQPED